MPVLCIWQPLFKLLLSHVGWSLCRCRAIRCASQGFGRFYCPGVEVGHPFPCCSKHAATKSYLLCKWKMYNYNINASKLAVVCTTGQLSRIMSNSHQIGGQYLIMGSRASKQSTASGPHQAVCNNEVKVARKLKTNGWTCLRNLDYNNISNWTSDSSDQS